MSLDVHHVSQPPAGLRGRAHRKERRRPAAAAVLTHLEGLLRAGKRYAARNRAISLRALARHLAIDCGILRPGRCPRGSCANPGAAAQGGRSSGGANAWLRNAWPKVTAPTRSRCRRVLWSRCPRATRSGRICEGTAAVLAVKYPRRAGGSQARDLGVRLGGNEDARTMPGAAGCSADLCDAGLGAGRLR